MKTACNSDPKNTGKNILSANIFPNPFDNDLNLEVYLLEDEIINVELLTITGQLIQNQSFDNTRSGLNLFMLNTTNLSQGMYLLKMNSKDEILIQKMVKGED